MVQMSQPLMMAPMLLWSAVVVTFLAVTRCWLSWATQPPPQSKAPKFEDLNPSLTGPVSSMSPEDRRRMLQQVTAKANTIERGNSKCLHGFEGLV